MTLDVHAHLFPERVAPKVLAQLEEHYAISPVGTGTTCDLRARLDAAGIDGAVVHTAATTPDQVVAANTWAISLSRDHHWITAFGTAHPGYAGSARQLDRLEAAGIQGLKFHCDFQGFPMDDPALCELLRAARGRFVIMFHVGDRLPPDKSPSTPGKLARLAERFPDTAMIGAHLGGYLHWKDSLDRLAGSGVYVDTSSSLSFIDQDTLEAFFLRHPFERILFGSDYPLFDPGAEQLLLNRRLGFGDETITALQNNTDRLFSSTDSADCNKTATKTCRQS